MFLFRYSLIPSTLYFRILLLHLQHQCFFDCTLLLLLLLLKKRFFIALEWPSENSCSAEIFPHVIFYSMLLCILSKSRFLKSHAAMHFHRNARRWEATLQRGAIIISKTHIVLTIQNNNIRCFTGLVGIATGGIRLANSGFGCICWLTLQMGP
jgi:hypothetical protein